MVLNLSPRYFENRILRTEDDDPVRRMWNQDLAACLNFIHIMRSLRVSSQVPESFRRGLTVRRRP
ncbi:hypothetical protein BX666DRAFT_731408 [Dichotomocladium elegans]|nr:hypothetical protein BX666DRAFT_731408 [Dichotomocladium elegans]